MLQQCFVSIKGLAGRRVSVPAAAGRARAHGAESALNVTVVAAATAVQVVEHGPVFHVLMDERTGGGGRPVGAGEVESRDPGPVGAEEQVGGRGDRAARGRCGAAYGEECQGNGQSGLVYMSQRRCSRSFGTLCEVGRYRPCGVPRRVRPSRSLGDGRCGPGRGGSALEWRDEAG